MKIYQASLLVSESGKYAKISAPNGRIIAEFVVDGPLAVAAYNAVNNIPQKSGRVNFFSGELIQLEKGERIDPVTECIIDRFRDTDNTESKEIKANDNR